MAADDRGGRGLAPRKVKMSRALLVIDVQNEYFTGALPITHPAGHLENILGVMDAAHGRVPTVVVQHHFSTSRFSGEEPGNGSSIPRWRGGRAIWSWRKACPEALQRHLSKPGFASEESRRSRSPDT